MLARPYLRVCFLNHDDRKRASIKALTALTKNYYGFAIVEQKKHGYCSKIVVITK